MPVKLDQIGKGDVPTQEPAKLGVTNLKAPVVEDQNKEKAQQEQRGKAN